jgi:LmbE family N-acetylglucosaminyl deacetylase
VHEQEDAAAMLGADIFWGGFEDGAIPSGRPVVELIEKVLGLTGADVVYVHGPNDSHQDHRTVSLAASAACRRMPRVCFYESPSTTRFDPSFFVDIGSDAEAKLDLIRAHVSQVLKNGMVDLEAVEASARYRGFQARTRFAEAFELGRFTWPLEQRRDDSAAVEGVIDLRKNLGVEKEILV